MKSLQLRPDNQSLDLQSHIKARFIQMNVCNPFVSTKVGSRVGNFLEILVQNVWYTQLQMDSVSNSVENRGETHECCLRTSISTLLQVHAHMLSLFHTHTIRVM